MRWLRYDNQSLNDLKMLRQNITMQLSSQQVLDSRKLLRNLSNVFKRYIKGAKASLTHMVYSDFDVCVHVNCQRHIHEPCNIKMEHFAIIHNSFQPFAIVAKSSILNFVGFLDPPLHCSKFAAQVAACFRPKKHVYVFLHTLGESI